MKKLVLLFVAMTLLVLTSCVNDDNDVVSPLLRTIVNGTDPAIIITYNGNKIVKMGDSKTFTYTGDLITRCETAEGDNMHRIDYIYDGNKLISEEGVSSDTSVKVDYIYNPDGTVTAKFNSQTGEQKTSWSFKYTIVNGNIVKQENFNAEGKIISVGEYEYDDKNNPFYNVIGFDKLFVASYGRNNITKTIGNGSVTTVYNYNDKGYPVTAQSTNVSGGDAPVVTNTQYGYYTDLNRRRY